jgi:TP901 family phage tail tape measure protein
VATVANLFIRIAASSTEFEKTLKQTESAFNRTGAKWQSIGANLTKAVSLPILAVGGAAVVAAVKFESSFAGIRKTVNATQPQFAALEKTMREMSKAKGIDVNELNKIGEIGGQMGIGAAGMKDFVSLIADVGTVTNISTEQAAAGFGKLASIMGTPSARYQMLGDVVNALGNSMEATETEILDFGLKIAASGKLAGLTEGQVLAIGAAMASVGVQADEGGTAVQKVLLSMTTATGELAAQFGEVASLGAGFKLDFEQAFASDPGQTLIYFLDGIAKSGKDAATVLKQLGIDDARQIKAFLSLASAGDKFTNAMKIQNEQVKIGGSLAREVAERNKTAEAQWNKLKVAINDVAISFGQQLLPHLLNLKPAVEGALNVIVGLVKWFAELPEPVQKWSIALVGLGVALGPVGYAIGTFHKAIASIAGLLRGTGIASVIGSIGKAIAGLGSGGGLGAFGTVLLTLAKANPIGFFVTLGTTVISLSKTWTEAFAVIAAAPIGGIISSWQNLREAWDTYFGNIEMPKLPGSPGMAVNAPIGPARSIAEAMALLDKPVGRSGSGGGGGGEEAAKAAAAAAKAHRDAIKSMSEGLSGATAAKQLSDLAEAWRSLPPSIQQSKPVLDKVLEGYMRLSGDLTNVPANLKPVVSQLNGMALAAGEFADNIDIGVTNLDGLSKAVDESGNSLLDSFDLWRDFADLIALETPGNAGANAASIGSIIGAMPDYGKPEDPRPGAGVAGFGDAFSGIGKDLSSAIISAFSGGGDVAKTIGAVAGSALGEGLSNIFKGTDFFKGLGGMMGGIMGQVASMFGPILGAIMGPLVDKIVDAIHETDAEKAQKEIGREWGVNISDGTAQSIEETMKGRFGGGGLAGALNGEQGRNTKNNRWAAEVYHLGDIINDAGGLAAENVQQLEKQFRQAFVFLDEGTFTAAETKKVLDENFAAFAAYYTDRNELVSANVQEMIKLDHQFGTESKAVAEFVEQQTNTAVAGLQTFLENAQITSQGVADSVGATIGGIFASLTQEGASPLEALTQLAPSIEAFNAQLAQTGMTGGAAFAQIQQLSLIATGEITGPMVQAVSGLNDVFTGLHNAGLLTQEMFGGLSLQVAETFANLQGQGVSAQNAMMLMQPSLQRIWELQRQFGYEVDASTQAMLDQAETAGVVGEQHQSIQQQTLDVLKSIATVLGADIPAAAQAGATGVTNALAGIQVPDISVNVRPNWKDWDMPEQPGGPTGGTGSKSPTSSDWRPMAAGGIVTRPMHALIGEAGPEAVIPLDEWKDSGPSIRIDRVYGTVDKAFVESIAKTVQLGGKPATAWRGVR